MEAQLQDIQNQQQAQLQDIHNQLAQIFELLQR